MSDEHLALVLSILENQQDEARWLIYSDWLEEHGDYVSAERAREHRLDVTDEMREIGEKAYSFRMSGDWVVRNTWWATAHDWREYWKTCFKIRKNLDEQTRQRIEQMWKLLNRKAKVTT